MSHRVHPLLVQKDPEEQEEESGVHEEIEWTSRDRIETSPAASKSVTKRKKAEDLLVYSRQHHQRLGVLRPSKAIQRQNFNTDNQADDDARLSCESVLNRQMRLKEGQSAISGSKFSSDSFLCHDFPSDELQEDNYLLQKIPKRKRVKLTRGEAATSHKFEEKCYFRTNERMFSRKQESIESEDAVSSGLTLNEDEGPQQQMTPRREKERQNSPTCMEALHQMKGQKKLSKSRKRVVSGLTKVVTECTKKQELPESLDASDGEEVKGHLRKRTSKLAAECSANKLVKGKSNQTPKKKNLRLPAAKMFSGLGDARKQEDEGEYQCDLKGCTMSFFTSRELNLHKKNICPVKGCRKKFFSHKYLVQHRHVHMDDRPLKCPWKGCKMMFKWAWARTEHVRVHTGERPYRCAEPGCGQTFRFVSDFSHHKRKTGHLAKSNG